MQELIKIETNESGEQLVSGRELHEKLEIGTRYDIWINRMIEYGFIDGQDFVLVVQKRTTNNPKNPFTEITNHAMTIDMAKQICMIQKTPQGKKYREYFIECERVAKEQTRVLTRKQELALELFDGGSSAIIAHKELLEIETEELKQQHELEMKTQRDGNNKILSGVYEVVSMLGIQGLTVSIFNQWMVYKGLIEYKRFDDDKKDTAQPTELFFKYVAKEGYSLTSAPNNKGKIKMIYTTEFVNRILDEHFKSLIDYVKISE